MSVHELIGKAIKDIFVVIEFEHYGLDKADCYLLLDNDLLVDIPYGIDEADTVRIREHNPAAKSVFRRTGWGQKNDSIDSLKGRRISDIFVFPERTDKAFIALDNGQVITEVTVAPNGTGHAGLWVFDSVDEFEKHHGKDYVRLPGNRPD